MPHSLAGSSCVPLESKPTQTPPPYLRSQEASAFILYHGSYSMILYLEGWKLWLLAQESCIFAPMSVFLCVGASFWQLQLLEIRESLHHHSRERASPFPKNNLHLPCMIKTAPQMRKGERGNCCRHSSQRNTD